jgi:hypothetical protein
MNIGDYNQQDFVRRADVHVLVPPGISVCVAAHGARLALSVGN